ncbi:cell envelope integrity protein TolA [Sulfurimonas sp.]|uniref:cell envelope integrity protein TolA n=1 Tax=Sulfurimonas sp. TaxID=2022749 RepID=UPI0025D0B21E|nr:cell envelope integrity protein TolA [Sulfurimonas sp.]
MLFSKSNIDTYALKKDNYISISLDVPKLQTSKKRIIKTPIVEESVVEPGDVNIDDLFSDVWTKKIKKVKKIEKKVDNKRLLEIGKKSKKIDKNSVKSVSEKLTDNSNIKKSDDSEKLSTANAVNEYLAKIQALVYQNFVPPQNSQGHSVKAVIELSAIGKVMDFRILTYSAKSNLNDECDKIKDRLIGILFPANPQNKSGNYIVMLTSKE